MGQLEVSVEYRARRRAWLLRSDWRTPVSMAAAGPARTSRVRSWWRSAPTIAQHHRPARQLERVRYAQGGVGFLRPRARELWRRRRRRHPGMGGSAARAARSEPLRRDT